MFVALGTKQETYMRRIILSRQLATVAHLELCFVYKSNLPMLAELKSYVLFVSFGKQAEISFH